MTFQLVGRAVSTLINALISIILFHGNPFFFFFFFFLALIGCVSRATVVAQASVRSLQVAQKSLHGLRTKVMESYLAAISSAFFFFFSHFFFSIFTALQFVFVYVSIGPYGN